jgi:antitoxin component YwqK of YwqJK toxin-antitoxin module
MKKLLLIFIFFSGNLLAQKIELPDSIKSLLLADTTVINTGYILKTDTNKNQEGSYFTSYYNPHFIKERRDYLTIHRIGHWKYYREDGSIRRTEYRPYKPSNIETSTSFKKDGSKRYVQTLRRSETLRPANKSDKGPIKQKLKTITYYKNGNPKSSYTLLGLKVIGENITYYENGQMKTKYMNNLESKRIGKYLHWDNAGNLKKEKIYKEKNR